jgi:hypothetical protein
MQNEQIYFEMSMSLLTVLSMLFAFLGFFCALRFSKEWPTKSKRMFNIMTIVLYIAVVITGIISIFFINNSILQQIYVGVKVSYLLDFVIVCMFVAASAITAFQIYPKLFTGY